jgi:hypothetical protein
LPSFDPMPPQRAQHTDVPGSRGAAERRTCLFVRWLAG